MVYKRADVQARNYSFLSYELRNMDADTTIMHVHSPSYPYECTHMIDKSSMKE